MAGSMAFHTTVKPCKQVTTAFPTCKLTNCPASIESSDRSAIKRIRCLGEKGLLALTTKVHGSGVTDRAFLVIRRCSSRRIGAALLAKSNTRQGIGPKEVRGWI